MPLFLSGDTAITPSLLFSLLLSPPPVFFFCLLPNSIQCNRSSPPIFAFALPPSISPSLHLSVFPVLFICAAFTPFTSLATARCTSAHPGVRWVNWVVDMCLRGAGGGGNSGAWRVWGGWAVSAAGSRAAVSKPWQSGCLADYTAVRLGGGAGGGSALTCSNLRWQNASMQLWPSRRSPSSSHSAFDQPSLRRPVWSSQRLPLSVPQRTQPVDTNPS